MGAGLAFFDVDHTLTRAATGRRFAAALVRERLIPPRILFKIPLLYVAYRVGGFRIESLAASVALLRGTPLSRLGELARRCYSRRIDDDLYPEAVQLVRRLAEAGTRIVLASSTLDLVLEPLAQRLDAEAIIATSLEAVDGIVTGRLSVVAFGAGKLELAAAYAAARGISLRDCSFYTDSCHDLPLLMEVGRPVAVNPDRRLDRIARERGWERLDFRGRRAPPGDPLRGGQSTIS